MRRGRGGSNQLVPHPQDRRVVHLPWQARAGERRRARGRSRGRAREMTAVNGNRVYKAACLHCGTEFTPVKYGHR
jgi:hypothetical protein